MHVHCVYCVVGCGKIAKMLPLAVQVSYYKQKRCVLHTFSCNYIIPDMSLHPPCIHKCLNMWLVRKEEE